MSWQPGDPEAQPTVYLPQSDGATPLAYETYADPAEAHGWRKAYTDGEDTSVLPVVPDGSTGRQELRSRRRRTRRNKLTRRLAVAGGAAGVVALGMAVSGVFDSGAAGGAGGTPQHTTRPVHLPTGSAQDDDSTAQPLQAPPATTSAPSAAPSAGAATASPGATAGASTPGKASTAPAPTASAATAPPSAAPTPSATSGPTRRGHGHGHGGWSN